MRSTLKNHGLSLFFGAIFLLALAGQAVAGHNEYNDQQVTAGMATISLVRYLATAQFAADVTENWQSEYLQFLLYIWVTVWLVQRGSPESKEVDDIGTESDEDQLVGQYAKPDSPRWAAVGGWRTAVYGRSLGIVMGSIFFLCWLVQSITGRAAYDEEQLRQLQPPVTWLGYLGSADFWSRSLQNWQSEFLAVGSMAVLSIYLRQRGSPESKPVGASHEATSVSG